MKSINTSELIGAALDWAVTTLEDPSELRYGVAYWRKLRGKSGDYLHRYHQNWAQGGPIIEREEIGVLHASQLGAWGIVITQKWGVWVARKWDVGLEDLYPVQYGPTPLIAAMRCYVASRLGETVEIPDELWDEG